MKNPKTVDNTGSDNLNENMDKAPILESPKKSGKMERNEAVGIHPSHPNYMEVLAKQYITARRYEQANNLWKKNMPYSRAAGSTQILKHCRVDIQDLQWIEKFTECHGKRPGSIPFEKFASASSFHHIWKWRAELPYFGETGKTEQKNQEFSPDFMKIKPFGWEHFKEECPALFEPSPTPRSAANNEILLEYCRKLEKTMKTPPFGWKEFKAEALGMSRPIPGSGEKNGLSTEERATDLERKARLSAARNTATESQAGQTQVVTEDGKKTEGRNGSRSGEIDCSEPIHSVSGQNRGTLVGELNGPDQLMDRAMGPHCKSDGHSRGKGYAPSELKRRPESAQNSRQDGNCEVAALEEVLEHPPLSSTKSRSLGPQTESRPSHSRTPEGEDLAAQEQSTNHNGQLVDHRRTDHVPITTIPVVLLDGRSTEEETTENDSDSNAEQAVPKSPQTENRPCQMVTSQSEEMTEHGNSTSITGIQVDHRRTDRVPIATTPVAQPRRQTLEKKNRISESRKMQDIVDPPELRNDDDRSPRTRKRKETKQSCDLLEERIAEEDPTNADDTDGWAIPATSGNHFQDESPAKVPAQKAISEITSDGEELAFHWSRPEPTIEPTHDVPDWVEPELETEKTVQEGLEPKERRRVHFKDKPQEEDPYIPEDQESSPHIEGPTTIPLRLGIAIAVQRERAYQRQRYYRPTYHAAEIKEIVDVVTGDLPEWPDDTKETCGPIEGKIQQLNSLPNIPKIPIGRQGVDTHIWSGMTKYMSVPEGEELADAIQALAGVQRETLPTCSTLQEDLPYTSSGTGYSRGYRKSMSGPTWETKQQIKSQTLAATGRWTQVPDAVLEARIENENDIKHMVPEVKEVSTLNGYNPRRAPDGNSTIAHEDNVFHVAHRQAVRGFQQETIMREAPHSAWAEGISGNRKKAQCRRSYHTPTMADRPELRQQRGYRKNEVTRSLSKANEEKTPWDTMRIGQSPPFLKDTGKLQEWNFPKDFDKVHVAVLSHENRWIASRRLRFKDEYRFPPWQLPADLFLLFQESMIVLMDRFDSDTAAWTIKTTPTSRTDRHEVNGELLKPWTRVEMPERQMGTNGENPGTIQRTSQSFKEFMEKDATWLYDAGANDKGPFTKEGSNGTILPLRDKLIKMERSIRIILKDPRTLDLSRSEEDRPHLMELKANFIRLRLSERVGSNQDHPNRLRDRQRLIKDTALIIPLLMCWSTGHMLEENAADGPTVVEVRSIFKSLTWTDNEFMMEILSDYDFKGKEQVDPPTVDEKLSFTSSFVTSINGQTYNHNQDGRRKLENDPMKLHNYQSRRPRNQGLFKILVKRHHHSPSDQDGQSAGKQRQERQYGIASSSHAGSAASRQNQPFRLRDQRLPSLRWMRKKGWKRWTDRMLTIEKRSIHRERIEKERGDRQNRTPSEMAGTNELENQECRDDPLLLYVSIPERWTSMVYKFCFSCDCAQVQEGGETMPGCPRRDNSPGGGGCKKSPPLTLISQYIVNVLQGTVARMRIPY